MKAIPYYDRLMETLSPLNPKPMKTYREYDLTELERIETEMMIYDMHCFEADKLEKIVTIKGDIMGGKLVICATNILPSDEYPLPIFTSEVIQAVNHVGLRADFMPLADLALDMDYFNKYMMPMEEAWKRSKDLAGAGPERHHWARALTFYVKVCSETEKGDPAYMAPLNKRKNATLDTYRKWDPGRGPLETTVGKEKAHQIMDILF